MKQFALTTFLLLTIAFTTCSQETSRNFSEILQTYYLHKDKDLVDKTIVFLNNQNADYGRLEPILKGFFGALFLMDTGTKNDFQSNLIRFENSDIKQLFVVLCSSNIDSIYAMTPISPSLNDMNWSSYFATGDVKYLDRIISNIHHAENRIDRNLFLVGSSAKWSLCSNAKQDEQVKKYLSLVKDNKKVIKEILKNEPVIFKQEMVEVIKEQRAKGLWNEE